MLITRKLLAEIKAHIPDKRHTIITGARQVGKTSLLRILYKELGATFKDVTFLTLEDSRILHSINEHPENIFNYIPNLPRTISDGISEDRIFLMIDEIQYANDPTNFLKLLYDKYEDNLKVIATGSSAFYIDRKFKDSLAGRKRVFNLLPLSFDEFLSFKEAEALLSELAIIRDRSSYQSSLQAELKNFFLST